MPQITFREMKIGDYDEVVSLWNEEISLGISSSDSFERIRFYLERNPGFSYVACANEQIIGTVVAGHDGRRAFINHLLVNDRYRKHGVGGKLVELVEARMGALGLSKVYLFVRNLNASGQRFWKRNNYYAPDSFIVMRKSLSGKPFDTYHELDETNVLDYLLSAYPMEYESDVAICEVGNGNMNHIFRIVDANNDFMLKQSMPHGKIDVTVFEPVERNVCEARYIKYYQPALKKSLPTLHHADYAMALCIIEDLGSMKTLRKSLLDGDMVSGTGKLLGEYLAKEHYYSSLHFLSGERRSDLERKFENARCKKLTENYILSSPFFDSDDNRIDEELLPSAEAVWQNETVCAHAADLRKMFLCNRESLISGDFHSGNIFTEPGRIVAFDFEFACFAPIAYDIGTMIGNLLLAYYAENCQTRKDPSAHKEYIEMQIFDLISAFEAEMQSFGIESKRSIESMLCDAIGYAGCTLLGRTYGYCAFVKESGITGPRSLETKQQIIATGVHLLEDMTRESLKKALVIDFVVNSLSR